MRKDITVFAVGNEAKGDDGIGTYAGRLLEKEGFYVVFCRDSPENFLSKVQNRLVLVVDAALIDEDFRISSDIAGMPVLSTHGMSLKLIQDYLKAKGIDMMVAGIKPERVEFNVPLSEKAKERAVRLVSKLKEEFSSGF